MLEEPQTLLLANWLIVFMTSSIEILVSAVLYQEDRIIEEGLHSVSHLFSKIVWLCDWCAVHWQKCDWIYCLIHDGLVIILSSVLILSKYTGSVCLLSILLIILVGWVRIFSHLVLIAELIWCRKCCEFSRFLALYKVP